MKAFQDEMALRHDVPLQSSKSRAQKGFLEGATSLGFSGLVISNWVDDVE